jgi:E3 ubiquitin-protein ligase SHPRH
MVPFARQLDRLIRQLQHWRRTQPDVKHIIFSSWKDALKIVEAALDANDISWRSRSAKKDDTSIQEFTEDPDILVFLLHGERENSGLTL